MSNMPAPQPPMENAVSLRLATLASALFLAACGASQPGSDATGEGGGSQELNVYNWSDYVAPDTIANFEAATGIRVNYDVYSENETLETKLVAGGSGYDVVFPSARPFAERQIRSGLYAALDKSQLPNLAHMDPEIMEGLTDIDPGNAHLVPYMWGTTGLGINVARVQEALGADAPLDSWGLLFDPANASRLASCGIHVLDDDQEAFGAALIWLGRDPNAGSPDEIDAVREAYAAIRPHIRSFNNAEYKDALANGDACLVMGYSGDIGQVRDVVAEAAAATGREAPDIRYVIPKEGALRWMDVIAIPADARNPANAHAFVNYLMEPEVIADISDHVAYANANQAATDLIDAEIAADPGVYPPEEVRERLVDPVSLPDDVQRQRVRAWTGIKSGR